MPVHLYGQPADLDPICALGLPVVEDAAHAAESEYRGRKIGGLSDATCFSLYATKSIAAGEGGIVTDERDDLAEAIRDLHDHAPRPRLALRHRRARLQGEPLRRARGDRALPARQGRAPPRAPAAAGRALRRGASPSSTGSSRSRATRATRTRTTSTSSGSTRSGRARRATSTARARRREHRHERPLPARAPADRLPRAVPGPAAAAGRRAGRAPRCSRCRSRPRTPSADIEDAIEALRRVHAAFTG